jgi:hypothetical protein
MAHHLRTIAAGTAVGLVTLAFSAVPAHASHPVTRATTPVITAKMTKTTIKLSSDSVRAGRITFKAATTKGDHVLQLLKLHAGYTAQQLQSDIPKAFKGDTDAVARVDREVTWLGGAETRPGAPGWYDVSLKAGQYITVDQDGQGFGFLNVHGSTQKRPAVKTQGTITTFSYGFRTDGTIRANGWVKATNRADQPHFIELNRVKPGTTRQQVVNFFNHGGHGQPPFALKGGTGLGVISPGKTVAWRLDLHKGRYAMSCFWPDLFTGLPHIAMGMVDMVNIK